MFLPAGLRGNNTLMQYISKQMQPFAKIYPYIIIHFFYTSKQINYTNCRKLSRYINW